MPRLDVGTLLARAEVYAEAAGHLELEWTEDPIERAEGNKIKLKFYREAARLRQQARRLNASAQKRMA